MTLSSTRTSYFGSGQEVCRGVCDQEGAMKAAPAMRMASAAMGWIFTVAKPCSARPLHSSFLNEQAGDLPEAHEIRAGLLLDILECPTRRRVDDLLGPVDSQQRGYGHDHVLGINGALLVPLGLQYLHALAVGDAERAAALHSGTSEYRGKGRAIVVATFVDG